MEGFDRFRESLTSHLDQTSGKKGSMLGIDRDERTGLLIGSAISGLLGASTGKNPLLTGAAAYSKGVDNIKNRRMAEIDQQAMQEKQALQQMAAYTGYLNATKPPASAMPKPMAPEQIAKRLSDIEKAKLTISQKGKADPLTMLVLKDMDPDTQRMIMGSMSQGDTAGAIAALEREQKMLESQLPSTYRTPAKPTVDTQSEDNAGSFIKKYGIRWGE